MRRILIERFPNISQIGLTVAAVLASIVAGTSFLVYDSPFSPLLISGLILGIFLAVICLRKPSLALYTALLVVLLPIGLFPVSIQSNLNRFLTVIALVVWGVYVIIRRNRIVWTSTALLMLAFLIWSLLTVLWAQNLIVVKYELGGYLLRFVLFLFLLANEINTRESLDGLMYTMAIAGWIYILAGIYTIASKGYEVGTRLQILEENENTLGGIFPLVAIGVIWIAVRSRGKRKTLYTFLSFTFILLAFVLIALTGSRGGAVTWLITMLGYLILRQTRLWGVIGLFILVVAVIIAPLILSTTVDRFLDRTGDTLLGGREALWQAAWKLICDRPLVGVGIGNGPSAMMSYIRLYRSVGGDDRAVIHNPILTIWVETGLPGLLLYLGVLVSSLWSFIRQYRRYRKMGVEWLMPFFALTVSAFLGYFASWIKGGGMELSHSYFLMLAFLLIPSRLDIHD